ncbi:DDT domain-containing protein isoform X2 [Tasmannia lanceolata]|uniref:DDT domain-containing protein isoform X2 n=1 Tax=Tasmannia lanceolata TaxID=3420 RepID=UPI004063849D
MPLYKRKPFSLLDPPQDLNLAEPVFQVRFTKEIFRDYQEYLDRINLYRQRVWTCKVTGKTNLTYEEALVSERRATEKVQQFPEDLMAPVLRTIQFSTLRLKDLVNKISTRLQEQILEGAEFYGRKEESACPCKILKVLEVDGGNIRYEVGWFGKNKKITDTSIVNSDDLIRKKLPFSRDVLKSFIRESTSQSAPWVVHDKLARKHKILTEPPEELRDKFTIRDGCFSIKQSRKNMEGRDKILNGENGKINKNKRKKLEGEDNEGLRTKKKKAEEEEENPKVEPIKFPIDDLLVQPGPDDPVFTDRPSPARDFDVPMVCIGDLLMVWDFCSSFSRLLHLWPFSLEDFENALRHKDSDGIIILESHLAILRLLIKDEGEYFTAIREKRRKSKITSVNWVEYLCDFIEMVDVPELSSHIGTIKRGHYGLLDIHVKLCVFRELVFEALATNAIREQLDEYIEQQQALVATKREETREEARKRRQEPQNVKEEKSDAKTVGQGHELENGRGKMRKSKNDYNHGQNGFVPEEGNVEFFSSEGNHASENGESKHAVAASRNDATNQKMNAKVTAENGERSTAGDDKKVKRRENNKEKGTEGTGTEEQMKERFEREIEKRFIRTNPLGKDRSYNRYWFFRRDGRIFIETCDSKQWGYYAAKEELDALMGSLNPKGEREKALQKQLEKYYPRICSGLQKRSKDIAQKIALEEAVLRRSTRVRAKPKEGRSSPFLRYVNKWKEN